MKDKLFDSNEQLREIPKENNQELEYSFTLMFNQTIKFFIQFDCTDWSNAN
ncbi:immunity protein YezG family protein [Priestia megaterium]|uniref:immunity protein YezG family protein n=1 Tax=Priestia megaterium TaxID=1404 RepID=UPI0010403F27